VLKILKKLHFSNNYSVYSSIFRVFICLHLLKDVLFSNSTKNLIYKGELFLVTSDSSLLEAVGVSTNLVRANFDYLNLVYLILIIFFMFGVGKYITAFLLFVLVDVMQNLNHMTLNGGDNLLKFVVLYMVFINSYDYFSINSIKFKRKESEELSNLFSNLAGISICIHLCLVYFLSAIHKFHADVWFNGVATYYTLSSERFRGTPFNLLLAKNGFIVLLSTYMTLLIEISYPFLVWFKEVKKVVVVMAILLHLSIAILMMLYDFQMVFIMLQGFFFANKEILNKLQFLKLKISKTINKAKIACT